MSQTRKQFDFSLFILPYRRLFLDCLKQGCVFICSSATTANKKKCICSYRLQVTDSGIGILTQGNSSDKLLELRIAYCPQITYNVLAVVVANCPAMKILEFHNCCPAAAECKR